MTQLLKKLNGHIYPGLVTLCPGLVSTPCQVFGEHYISRSEDARSAVADKNLSMAREGNQVLSSRGQMPVLKILCLVELEDTTFGGLDLEVCMSAMFGVEVLEVRLAILA